MTIGSSLPGRLLIFAFALFGMNAHAASPLDAQVVMLKNGVNDVTLDGRRFTIVSGWRENFNAHGFNVTTMYAELQGLAAKCCCKSCQYSCEIPPAPTGHVRRTNC